MVIYLDDDVKDWWEATTKRMGVKPSTFVSMLLTSVANANMSPLDLLAAAADRSRGEAQVGTNGSQSAQSVPDCVSVGTPEHIHSSTGTPKKKTDKSLVESGGAQDYRADLFEEGWQLHRSRAKPGDKKTDGNCGWKQWCLLVDKGEWEPQEVLDRWKRRIEAHGPDGFALPHVQKLLRPGNSMLSDDSIEDLGAKRGGSPGPQAPSASPDLLDAIDVLSMEANRDVYPGHERHAEILADFSTQLLEGSALSEAQWKLLAKMAERVGMGCKPTQIYNCPPRQPSEAERRGLAAAALVAAMHKKEAS